jgi:hypothetical protein
MTLRVQNLEFCNVLSVYFTISKIKKRLKIGLAKGKFVSLPKFNVKLTIVCKSGI